MHWRWPLGLTVAATAEAALIYLGRSYGSTEEERNSRLPGDDLIAVPGVQTDHAVTIDAPPSAVWPWLVQMGWGRGAWTGLFVVGLQPERALVLRSNSHLPMSWRDHASLDWTWTFVLTPVDGGRRTRYHFRSRWVTEPWWFTLTGWLGIVPTDFVMSRDHLKGIKKRAEKLALAA